MESIIELQYNVVYELQDLQDLYKKSPELFNGFLNSSVTSNYTWKEHHGDWRLNEYEINLVYYNTWMIPINPESLGFISFFSIIVIKQSDLFPFKERLGR